MSKKELVNNAFEFCPECKKKTIACGLCRQKYADVAIKLSDGTWKTLCGYCFSHFHLRNQIN